MHNFTHEIQPGTWAAESRIGGIAVGHRRPLYRRKRAMLRITVVESPAEERWILQGSLTKSSVAELISSWRASSPCPSGRRRIVDLNKVTSIDKSGEEALTMIMRDGATVVASGVYTRHLLDELRSRPPD
jgi:hypothetical protein